MNKISFVIPCYRSENTIGLVVSDITNQFSNKAEYDYQILLVCDGSPDNTFEIIRALCKKNDKITGLDLSRNFGQQAARMAALPYVQGGYVVFMDDDGQHPVGNIFSLIKKLEEGYDLVYARFKHKKHTLLQRMGSYVNRKMTELLLGKPKNTVQSSFFAMKVFVFRGLQEYDSPTPYLFGYFMQITRNIANVEMEHQRRLAGESGYTLKKLLHLWMNGFTSFSVVPLRFSSYLGFLCSLIGFIIGIIIIIQKLLHPNIAAGYTSSMAMMLFIGGIIMMMLGLLGEYVGRIFLAINKLPQYVIREKVGV
jgi:undecaprenyl-phosphate 4-deoxy-4-formamido-L-arabinose transferase